MATKTLASGNTLKETINDEAEQCPTEQEKSSALDAIYAYLDEAENDRNSIAWYLHVFCRTGDGEDFGYDSSELEHTAWFCEQLIRTFLHPKASGLFCKLNGQTPKYLIEYLTRLQELFAHLRDNKVVEAQMDALNIKLFDEKTTSTKLHNLKLVYNRLTEMSQSHKRAINKYIGEFR